MHLYKKGLPTVYVNIKRQGQYILTEALFVIFIDMGY